MEVECEVLLTWPFTTGTMSHPHKQCSRKSLCAGKTQHLVKARHFGHKINHNVPFPNGHARIGVDVISRTGGVLAEYIAE